MMATYEFKDDRTFPHCFHNQEEDTTVSEPTSSPPQAFNTNSESQDLPSTSPTTYSSPNTTTSPLSQGLTPTTPTPTTPYPVDGASQTTPRDSEGGGRVERGRRRKSLHPQKSLSLMDPNFRGVTLSFQTVVHGATSELIITPYYSKNLARLQRRRRRRLILNSESDPDAGHSTPEENPASSEEHPHQHQHQHHRPQLTHQGARTPVSHSSVAVKSCASCFTRRTPLWRDAEDGTPLCNACGIRYRKYRLRCGSCWHIPRKDNKVFPACSQCGGILRFSQNRKC